MAVSQNFSPWDIFVSNPSKKHHSNWTWKYFFWVKTNTYSRTVDDIPGAPEPIWGGCRQLPFTFFTVGCPRWAQTKLNRHKIPHTHSQAFFLIVVHFFVFCFFFFQILSASSAASSSDKASSVWARRTLSLAALELAMAARNAALSTMALCEDPVASLTWAGVETGSGVGTAMETGVETATMFVSAISCQHFVVGY